jgi:hypothetical protein
MLDSVVITCSKKHEDEQRGRVAPCTSVALSDELLTSGHIEGLYILLKHSS